MAKPTDEAQLPDGLPEGAHGPDDPATIPHIAWPKAQPVTRLMALAQGMHNTWRALLRRIGRRPRRPGPYTILVTGASVGLGLEIAKLLLRSNHRLVLTAREQSMPRFAEQGILESERVMLHQLDVTDADEREALLRAVQKRFGGVDVLVNNAGVSCRAVVEHVTEAEAIAQMETNFFGPMALVRLFLPYMRKQRFGRVVNVSSVGGMTAMPTMALYSASKFALEGASESLWYEARPWGVNVTLVRPGFINSDAFLKVYFTEQGMGSLADPEDPYHRHYFNMNALIEALMQLTFHKPEDVAETVVRTIEHPNPPLRVAATWDAWIFDMMRRFLPARLYHRLLYAALPHVWDWGDLAPGAKPKPLPEPAEEQALDLEGDATTIRIVLSPLAQQAFQKAYGRPTLPSITEVTAHLHVPRSSLVPQRPQSSRPPRK
jgi:short-subunit dehydrogenase